MNHDDDWPINTLENRRLMVRKTIRPATVEELRQLGAGMFPLATDPWAERFSTFLAEHAGDSFYLAKSPEGAHIAYCRNANKGIWFLPGSGVGIIQPRGVEVLAEIVDSM
jgi:hypothetical protein